MMRTWIVYAAVAAVLAGCQRRMQSGLVVEDPQAKPLQMPYAAELAVKGFDGRTANLRSVVRGSYVVAFVQPEGQACCEVNPAVNSLARELADSAVDVVQITLPTEQCPLHERDVHNCPAPARNVLRFYDPDRVAWAAYAHPPAGTVYLIGPDNRVERIASLDYPDELISQARELARDREVIAPPVMSNRPPPGSRAGALQGSILY